MRYISADSVVAGVAGIVFLAASSVPVYMYMRIQSSQEYVEQVASVLAQQVEEERTAALTRQALVDTADERAQLDALVVTEDSVAGFISTIEQEARSAGVSFEVGNVSTATKQGFFDALELTFKATGPFPAVSRFLKLLETTPYASSVLSVVFSKENDKTTTWSLTGLISVPIHKKQ